MDACHRSEAEVTAAHPGATVKDENGLRFWYVNGRVVAVGNNGVVRDTACLPS